MLNTLIEKSIRYIQPVWPLQQFIATNPFWDKIDCDIKSLTKEVFVKTGNMTFHRLSQLGAHYCSGQIQDNCLLECIDEYISLTTEGTAHSEEQKSKYNKTIYAFIKDLCLAQKNDDFGISLNHNPKEILVAYRLDAITNQSIASSIREDCVRWIGNYLALAKKKKTTAQSSLFIYWRQSMLNIKGWHSILHDLPSSTDDFIEALLEKFNVSNQSAESYLFQIIWQLKGWFGYMKWQQEHSDNPWNDCILNIKDLIALWLAYELYHLEKYGHPELKQPNPPCDNNINDLIKKTWLEQPEQQVFNLDYFDVVFILQRAFEISKSDALLTDIKSTKKSTKTSDKAKLAPSAQWVFCIDTRSEGIRRQLESLNDYETYGYAGFFGFANQFHDTEKEVITNQYPVILQPSRVVAIPKTKENTSDETLTCLTSNIVAHRKKIPAAYFVYEIFGIWFAMINLIKTFYPDKSSKISQKFDKNSLALKKEGAFTIPDITRFYDIALNTLKGMSLTNNFAKFVIICGHHAQTEGNPYKSSLDCGACGGHSGFYNAAFACQVFNNQQVRHYLDQNGIHIPDETIFIAACHNTTTGKIEFDLKNQLTPSVDAEFNIIQQDANIASDKYNQERSKDFIGYDNFDARANDWAQLMPELGLINNFAIIIGPRAMTKKIHLNRSVFLHSYYAENDKDGKILSSILGGPVLVAHWINMQYFYSAACPELFASGNKAIHNIVSGVGVMEGNQSDLKSGLPLQSLFHKDKLLHEPRRLEVIIAADSHLVQRLVEQNESLNALVRGGWIFLKCI
tara:strand:+ start:12701 stop:15085 length:2385 start_codon:yes stop_codon:yes gene_type:complete